MGGCQYQSLNDDRICDIDIRDDIKKVIIPEGELDMPDSKKSFPSIEILEIGKSVSKLQHSQTIKFEKIYESIKDDDRFLSLKATIIDKLNAKKKSFKL